MPKYRLSVEFDADNMDEAEEKAREYCDWGGEPSFEAMEREGMKVEKVNERTE